MAQCDSSVPLRVDQRLALLDITNIYGSDLSTEMKKKNRKEKGAHVALTWRMRGGDVATMWRGRGDDEVATWR